MARIKDIVIDADHPATVARFWAAALDDYRVAPYDAAELERLRGQGIDDPEDDPTVLVEPNHLSDTAPRIFVQRVPEPRRVKNRVHLDLVAADRSTEVARLIGLGARQLAVYSDHTVLSDPEGNEFCVIDES